MNPQEREEAIIGPSVNAAAGPVGGYFPLQGGKPAFVLNFPMTELGVNVSHSSKIF